MTHAYRFECSECDPHLDITELVYRKAQEVGWRTMRKSSFGANASVTTLIVECPKGHRRKVPYPPDAITK